ncbi:MAG: histidinol-phosphate transaminase [Oscillatoriales cyanobacterium C42_A2020_001]|nr:histidinol-phosphate transaminase [Leptolyngbyaceae cyanobacterium C42_A2020_001]
MLPFIRSDLSQLTAYIPHSQDSLDSVDSVGAKQESELLVVDRLDTNESPYDLPDELKQELGWALQDVIKSNRYPDGGHYALKQAIADYVNESAGLTHSPLTASHISLGNGSDELIRSILIATCLRSEGSILVADPTFSMYGILAQTLGIPVVHVTRSPDTFAIDLQAAQIAITQPQQLPVRVVFVVHPNSPTGNALTTAEVAWLKALPNNILVVIDEAYFEFSQTTLASEIQHHPNWVILRTFSKAFRLAAYRVGYAIAHPQIASVLEKVRLPYNLPSISQVAAQFALTHRQKLLQTIPQILQERDTFITTLQQQPLLKVWQSQANFVFTVPVSETPGFAEIIFQSLNRQGTAIRCISGGLRITIGTPTENSRTLHRLIHIVGSTPLPSAMPSNA